MPSLCTLRPVSSRVSHRVGENACRRMSPSGGRAVHSRPASPVPLMFCVQDLPFSPVEPSPMRPLAVWSSAQAWAIASSSGVVTTSGRCVSHRYGPMTRCALARPSAAMSPGSQASTLPLRIPSPRSTRSARQRAQTPSTVSRSAGAPPAPPGPGLPPVALAPPVTNVPPVSTVPLLQAPPVAGLPPVATVPPGSSMAPVAIEPPLVSSPPVCATPPVTEPPTVVGAPVGGEPPRPGSPPLAVSTPLALNPPGAPPTPEAPPVPAPRRRHRRPRRRRRRRSGPGTTAPTRSGISPARAAPRLRASPGNRRQDSRAPMQCALEWPRGSSPLDDSPGPPRSGTGDPGSDDQCVRHRAPLVGMAPATPPSRRIFRGWPRELSHGSTENSPGQVPRRAQDCAVEEALDGTSPG